LGFGLSMWRISYLMWLGPYLLTTAVGPSKVDATPFAMTSKLCPGLYLSSASDDLIAGTSTICDGKADFSLGDSRSVYRERLLYSGEFTWTAG
jgi:hypothetical protein